MASDDDGDHTATGGEDEETNPYLRLRNAKIARNENRLNELGLLKKKSITAKPSTIRTAKKKEKTPLEPTRRSSRQAGRPESYRDVADIVGSKKRSLEQPDETRVPEQKKRKTKAATNAAPYVPAENSVRRIDISVEDTVNKFLGKIMEKTGKAFVVESTLGGMVGASFNKYSGVQEWGNDAIFLWVNIGKKDDDVVNDFLTDGRQITWYGGARMHDESPVIQRLLKLARNKSVKPENGVILWCRHYNPEKKTYHPYTCFGRLSYESHVPGSRPLQFCWNIEDYDRLVQHEDETIRKRFKEIVNL